MVVVIMSIAPALIFMVTILTRPPATRWEKSLGGNCAVSGGLLQQSVEGEY